MRPNVVFILTDQQSADAMSCVGNDDLNTPAMDSLAQHGTVFRNAYCTQPLCSPSRASMLTGRVPHEMGVVGNEAGLTGALREQQLGRLFAGAGYDCAYGGKWHLPGYDLDGDLGYDHIIGFGDDELAARCADFLRAPRDRPFFLVASFDNPHNICEWARNEPLPWGGVAEVPTEQCPSLPANFAAAPDEPQLLRIVRARFPRQHPTDGWSDDLWRQYRHAYYRLCERVDTQIGMVLDALRESGHVEDTVVVLSSDHGDGMGAHHWNQKWALYEEAVRVPFIVSWKGVTRPGHVDTDTLVSSGLDLLPTLCDYAGIEPPDGLRGHSVRPAAEGREHDGPAYVVTETSWDPAVLPHSRGRMLRTARYKYVLYSWGQHREQLFDLHDDPGEMVNLVRDASHRDVLDEHRKLLAAWCDQTGDDFLDVRQRGEANV
ncbi:sulfatase [Jiangella asiatica]|uniref:DUF229 domain-containing protein n=1 Tax=Jiangella asiatica TaxID=2530372 RepID=A0A4R5D773_9ACTN|nr:sulfatase-like hydrolase/transferase [Jiangella asiatica]TDE09246.1 DUF229 domain-containing protein [Jiangella asiatica]